MPAPLREEGGQALRSAPGWSRRLSRRSESTQTMVMAVPDHVHAAGDTGVPWKLAPVSVRLSSGRKIGLSPTPLSSISTCARA